MTIHEDLGLTEERAKEIAIDVVKEIQRNPVVDRIKQKLKQKYLDISEYTFAIICLERYIIVSAQHFQNVAGKGAKWAENLRGLTT